MPNHPDLRALEVVYRYRLDDVDEAAKLPRAALTVALAPTARRSARWRRSRRSTPAGFSEATESALEGLARRAGPAIGNAMRFAEAREHAELDSLTGLHNRRLFYEFLAREIARAHRYERFVSVIVFDLDDFKRINDRIGHLDGDAVLVRGRRARPQRRPRDRHRLPRRRRRVRGDPARVEPRRRRAARRPDRDSRSAAQKIAKVGSLKISAGVAELRSDDTAADLFKRADQALYRAKNAGKSRVVAS